MISAPKVSSICWLVFWDNWGKSSDVEGIAGTLPPSPPLFLYCTSSYAKCSNSCLKVSTVDYVSCLNDSDFSNWSLLHTHICWRIRDWQIWHLLENCFKLLVVFFVLHQTLDNVFNVLILDILRLIITSAATVPNRRKENFLQSFQLIGECHQGFISFGQNLFISFFLLHRDLKLRNGHIGRIWGTNRHFNILVHMLLG